MKPTQTLSTLDWIASLKDRQTGNAFLSDAQYEAAEKFSLLCEKLMRVPYQKSNFNSYIDCPNRKAPSSPYAGSMRHILAKACRIIGKDIAFFIDIVIKNYPLYEAETKYKYAHGFGKYIIRNALDQLVVLFSNSKPRKTDIYAVYQVT